MPSGVLCDRKIKKRKNGKFFKSVVRLKNTQYSTLKPADKENTRKATRWSRNADTEV